ncbi:hypothetical protein GJAV_G00102300 [Gymnothorax javanicus]|nr:hypothetical protein GJAV_G00102300 [Gymnothorax javanicus]
MTLSKGQLTELLQKEFGDCLGNATDHAAVEDLFRILDEDQSGCVDFKEYMSFVTALTMMCCDNITKKH